MARLALATLPKRKKAGAAGAPAWIVTFADLATLLLTFFILLLSFAEMDLEKYKAMAGYTDDRPIASSRYRSNWDLSAARAVSVVHELVLSRDVPADRVVAAGRAETNPLVPNNSPENRAVNRRVEIAIRDPVCRTDTPAEQIPAETLP
ncbi:flagellar motor protein MotB [Marinobacter gelidimuriae]|uniref:flagellar motor protein MotB n=1 Tax=Marinobacter gelidimuriae TaxID=2739064 RepID=UPI00037F31DA|nr:flagellar motor protein MotB [Marinobacter gelidimuriae]